MPATMRFGICAIVKDELTHIREWVAFHRIMGAERMWLACNDSDPAPLQRLLAQPIEAGLVTLHHMPGEARQLAAYRWGADVAASASCAWVAFIDADEFILPQVHANIPETLIEYESYAGVVVNWVQFAAKGVDAPPESVLASNVWRLPLHSDCNRHVKLIARPETLDSFRDPHSASFREGRFAVTQHGERVDGSFAPITGTRMRLHHYFLRSRKDFADKIRRGRADIAANDDGSSHRNWHDWDWVDAAATEWDGSALRYLQAVQQELAAMRSGY